jgi:hypothetical protein
VVDFVKIAREVILLDDSHVRKGTNNLISFYIYVGISLSKIVGSCICAHRAQEIPLLCSGDVRDKTIMKE